MGRGGARAPYPGEFRPYLGLQRDAGTSHFEYQVLPVAELKTHDQPPGCDQAQVDRVRILLAAESRVNRQELTAGIVTGDRRHCRQGDGVVPEVLAGHVECRVRIAREVPRLQPPGVSS